MEAESVASLNHPNIVPLYEVGEVEGNPFFTMEFIQGGRLAGWVAKPPSDPASHAPFDLRRAATVMANTGS